MNGRAYFKKMNCDEILILVGALIRGMWIVIAYDSFHPTVNHGPVCNGNVFLDVCTPAYWSKRWLSALERSSAEAPLLRYFVRRRHVTTNPPSSTFKDTPRAGLAEGTNTNAQGKIKGIRWGSGTRSVRGGKKFSPQKGRGYPR